MVRYFVDQLTGSNTEIDENAARFLRQQADRAIAAGVSNYVLPMFPLVGLQRVEVTVPCYQIYFVDDAGRQIAM
jgi:hypothetical protein